MTDWSQLDHAYGTAQDIPGLLAAMSPGPEDACWNDLWSALCHQGTVYSASYAALPALAEAARRWSVTERRMPLYLAGAIVASLDRPGSGEDPYLSRSAEIAEMRQLTEEALRDPGLAHDPLNYVQLLGTLLTFEGVEVWGEQLDGLNGEEYVHRLRRVRLPLGRVDWLSSPKPPARLTGRQTCGRLRSPPMATSRWTWTAESALTRASWTEQGG